MSCAVLPAAFSGIMSRIKELMNDSLGAAMRHLDDDNGIFLGFCIPSPRTLSDGTQLLPVDDLLVSEVSLTTRQSQERDSDFIRDYELTVMVRQSDFPGDAELYEGELATYKNKERRIMAVRQTPDNLEWFFDLGAKYKGR